MAGVVLMSIKVNNIKYYNTLINVRATEVKKYRVGFITK